MGGNEEERGKEGWGGSKGRNDWEEDKQEMMAYKEIKWVRREYLEKNWVLKVERKKFNSV